MDNSRWYATPVAKVQEAFNTPERGLTSREASLRLVADGANALPTKKSKGIFLLFLGQFASPLIYLLLGAAAIIYFTEEPVDAYIVLAILIFNAVVGTIQEGRAQNTLNALKTFAATSATVRRDGVEMLIPDTEVVAGDILLLAEGEKVAADARVLSGRGLRVDESALTGESEPVEKDAQVLADTDLVVGDQVNMVFKGTNTVAGSAEAVVVATGLRTVLGTVAKELAGVATEIPLQATIRRLSHLIIGVVALVSTTLFTIGIFMGHSVASMFATVVTLAVSIIPEGLPIVLTLVLASGVWRMSKRNALVKNLQAVEALGQASVIAVDKTGTITKNEMVVQKVYIDGKLFDVSGNGYVPEGNVSLEGDVVVPLNHAELLLAGKTAAYTAGARVAYDDRAHRWRVAGDPTEAALIVFARKIGFEKETLERESPVIAELPFSSEQRFHAAVYKDAGTHKLSVTGAPEYLLAQSTHLYEGGQVVTLTDEKRQELEGRMLLLSGEGLRVLAFAERDPAGSTLAASDVRALTFVGFFGMKDGLKAEVPDALMRARNAGIKVAMITGDHVETARAIAREAGIYTEGDGVLTGTEIDALSDEALASRLSGVTVFARVTPEHKLRIIQAYRAHGETVAMTGDGINDAPSLVAADLGVAMGKIGTEVAKEAADIVLLDDNFGSIVAAVEEGRNIYKNIERVVLYLFSTSLGETLTIAGALVASYPLPVLPAQIIWLNFVTDGFLDVALAMEPQEKNLLKKKFVRPGRYLITKLMGVRMLLMALVMATTTLFLFGMFLPAGLPKALTISMTLLAVLQWLNAWNCRSEDRSVFAMNPFGNPYLIGATLLVIVLQMFAVYHPFGHMLLHTVPLSATEWQYIIIGALPIVVVEEVRKAIVRLIARRSRTRAA